MIGRAAMVAPRRVIELAIGADDLSRLEAIAIAHGGRLSATRLVGRLVAKTGPLVLHRIVIGGIVMQVVRSQFARPPTPPDRMR